MVSKLRFIFAERGGIYIIDLTQTSERLDEAQQFLRNVAERGGTVLFVGTKKQAQDAVEHLLDVAREIDTSRKIVLFPTSDRIAKGIALGWGLSLQAAAG